MVSCFPEHKKIWGKEEKNSLNAYPVLQHQRMQLNPNIVNVLWDVNGFPPIWVTAFSSEAAQALVQGLRTALFFLNS